MYTCETSAKSITSSRKVVDLMNKLGHCCSYNVVEELETEATVHTCSSSNVSPQDAVLAPNYCTGVAFDNFDRFVETSNGKDTLHDTVGILYQNITQIDNTDEIVQSHDSMDVSACEPVTKRRRTLDPILPELQMYTKKLFYREKLLPIDSDLRTLSAAKYDFYQQLDVAWVLSHYCKVPDTPMWVGFNYKITNDSSVKQKISYLTPINESPTNPAVVYETMRQSQKIARECQQNCMQITYDLAISKLAYQIQSIEKPHFDDLFIHMGAFHVMMAYFKAVGKFIDDCGLTHMMVESKLLASESVNGFISGKHYNRCKRLHPLISLGLQLLHIEFFIQKNGLNISEQTKNFLIKLQSEKLSNDAFTDREFVELIEKYRQFKKDTLIGTHGKTAQFYMMYIEFINYYMMFTRSIRVGDFDLYKFIMPKLSNLFFIFNQVNYARWLLKYHEDLLLIEKKHPRLAEEFKRGMFGIRRTSNSFSRIPIDLTLEQTVNADAAKRLTGVTHFTNSISARQQWAKSHGLRSYIISHVFEYSGLKKIQDATSRLEKYQIVKDSESVLAFVNKLKNNLNPFDNEKLDKDQLYNIKSGRTAPDSVAEFLQNVEKKGQELREKFIIECSQDDRRFESTIKQNKIMNFTSCNAKKKIIVNNKVQEVRMQHDLFGRMLGISMENSTDLENIFTFPITPMPPSLCHSDGTICDTKKAVMMKILRCDSHLPAHIDVVIVDGFFLIHTMRDVPQLFGNISKKILQILTSYNARCVHIIFDRYCSPSIKDYERSSRRGSESNHDYVISGPEQARTNDFTTELKNDRFKEALVTFLISHWQSNEVVPFIRNKTVVLNYLRCYEYNVNENGNVVREEKHEFFCPSHEEADSKIIYHASKMNPDTNVVVKCSDTDITIIMLGNIHKISANIYIECGTAKKRHIINVRVLQEKLGSNLCRALPGFHAMTGCDYNPAFYNKGKQRPFKLLQKNAEFQKAFANLGNTSVAVEETFEKIETFICLMYGFKSMKNINHVRFQMFLRNYKMKNTDEAFFKKNLKNFDASCLPPCHSELNQQMRRAHYITHVWNNATLSDPVELDPEDYGWTSIDNKYEFLWFEGPQLPSSVKDVILIDEQVDSDLSEYDSDEDPDYEDDEENVSDTNYETD